MIHFDMPPQKSNIIKVLGFGGGGGNAVNHMYRQRIENVDFIVCNTDAQALAQSDVPNKIQLGPHLTQGLGAGANPNIGKQAAEESLEEIQQMMEVNTRMAFITAGMGGGTGTGAAPTVAKICKDLGILTVGIVTTPFSFEGPKRMKQAQDGIRELKDHVDTLLVISNDKLRQQYGNLKMKDAFGKADDVLTTAARCITDVINTKGEINVDFADVCTVMRNGGVALLGSAREAGEDRALRAIEAAINSPLLNDNDISGAKWLLVNITSADGDFGHTMDEVDLIQDYIRRQTGDDTDFILGMGYDDSMGEQLGITIIATGFQHKDPFAKPIPVKVVAKPEAPIVMTLGVPGEERKMYEKPKVPVTEPAAAPLMPVMQEREALSPVEEPAVLDQTTVESFNPVTSNLNQDETDELPMVFELSIETTKEPEAPAAEMPKSEEQTQQKPEAGPQKMSDDHPVFSGFLPKPTQIYSEKPSAPKWPFHQPEEKQAAPKPTAREESQEPFLTEETRPTLKVPNPKEEEEVAGISLSFEEDFPAPANAQASLFANPAANSNFDLSEEEEQKKRAQERINRLRNLSFNPANMDNNSEFEQVPAYLRRNMELHNSIANVEDFYSRAQVKTDDKNNTTISTLNNFLHGEKPD